MYWKLCIVLSIIGLSCSGDNYLTVLVEKDASAVQTQLTINITNGAQRDAYFFSNKDLIGFWKLERKFDGHWIAADKAGITYNSVYAGGMKKLATGEVLHDSIMIYQPGRYRMLFPFAWDENGVQMDSVSPVEFIVE